jgi:hypothetical protein
MFEAALVNIHKLRNSLSTLGLLIVASHVLAFQRAVNTRFLMVISMWLSIDIKI